MKDTRLRIKLKAIELFNEQGLGQTVLRHIAKELGISQGNLNYHFRLKSDLIEELYFDLVAELDEQISQMPEPGSQPIMQLLFESSQLSMQILFRYRFFLRDLYAIMREHQVVKEHFITLRDRRSKEFGQVFSLLIHEGLMRPPELANEYERLYERMQIFGDNWINSVELFLGDEEKPVPRYAALLFEMIYPYLTPEGKLAYSQAVPKS